MRRTLVAAVAIAALAIGASACGGASRNSGAKTATPNRTLTDLHTISQLRQAFNTASGEPRLIVLVSPT